MLSQLHCEPVNLKIHLIQEGIAFRHYLKLDFEDFAEWRAPIVKESHSYNMQNIRRHGLLFNPDWNAKQLASIFSNRWKICNCFDFEWIVNLRIFYWLENAATRPKFKVWSICNCNFDSLKLTNDAFNRLELVLRSQYGRHSVFLFFIKRLFWSLGRDFSFFVVLDLILDFNQAMCMLYSYTTCGAVVHIAPGTVLSETLDIWSTTITGHGTLEWGGLRLVGESAVWIIAIWIEPTHYLLLSATISLVLGRLDKSLICY